MSFYNREPWNLMLGFCLMVFLLLAIAEQTSYWVLLAPPLLVAILHIKFHISRALQLKNKGYFSGWRVRDNWVYEERNGKLCERLVLRVENTEPGHYEIFFPTEQQWRESVPKWAQDRRDEVAQRIAEAWRPEDVHFP